MSIDAKKLLEGTTPLSMITRNLAKRVIELEAINAELVEALNDAYMDGIFEHVEVARKIKTALKHAEESNG